MHSALWAAPPFLVTFASAAMFSVSKDAAGLFGGVPTRDGDGESSGKKRVSLKDSESVAAVMLKSWEASLLEDVQLKELWNYISQGTKYIEYHSELAATESTGGDYRVGVGLSRHAELLVNVIERLKQDEGLKRLIVKEYYERAMTEARELLPHLKKLHFGKGSLKKYDAKESLRNLKNKRSLTEEVVVYPSEQDLDKAAAVLYKWLQSEASPLRALLLVISAGGLPYAATAGEMTLRAWVQGGGATEETVSRAAKAIRTARVSGSEPTSSSVAARKSEIASLFP